MRQSPGECGMCTSSSGQWEPGLREPREESPREWDPEGADREPWGAIGSPERVSRQPRGAARSPAEQELWHRRGELAAGAGEAVGAWALTRMLSPQEAAGRTSAEPGRMGGTAGPEPGEPRGG